jgi:hypothetical protein
MWATLACNGGDREAQSLCSALDDRLSARERWDARRLAREWQMDRELA